MKRTGLIALSAFVTMVGCVANVPAPTQSAGGQGVGHGAVKLAPTTYRAAKGAKLQRAILAGGCFWGTEFHFRALPGVTATAVGYIGGTTSNPTYEQVCTHKSGHAEAVMVEFDTSKLAFRDVLARFWDVHNPCTLNSQGPDYGDNYRSAIFYLNDVQKAEAEKSMREAAPRFKRPIVTQLVKAPTFWLAEEYHQQYAEKTGKNHCPIDRRDHVGGG